jgi:hypothetical protein
VGILTVITTVVYYCWNQVRKAKDQKHWTAGLKRLQSLSTLAEPETLAKPANIPFWSERGFVWAFTTLFWLLLASKALLIRATPATSQDVALVGMLTANIVQVSAMGIRPLSEIQAYFP